jgi:hypothetical protein
MEREPYPWGVVLVIVVFVVLFIFVQEMRGQTCGDCNDDARVTIDEIVRVINSALDDPCGGTDCATPDEFPSAVIDDIRWTCTGPVCRPTPECVRVLLASGRCFEE